MPTTKVTSSTYTDSNGDERKQHRTTVPKSVVELLGLEGKSLDWEMKSSNRIEITVVDEDDD